MSIPLEIVNLSKTYDSKEAVQNISFKVNKNEIIGILGPNGCGKTTTIGMILGLLKPTKGKVLINGIEIEKKGWPSACWPISRISIKQNSHEDEIISFTCFAEIFCFTFFYII